MTWADQHCHLPPGDEGRDLVDRAFAAGVEVLINVGTDVANSRQALITAAGNEGVWATAGVHPHEASGGIDDLEELLSDRWVVAVGETGLDYHYDHSPRNRQRRAFAAQIEMANRRELPLVVHSRSAWDDTFAILDREGIPERTVLHCFSGGPEEAGECLARGALLSFSGIVTFPGTDTLKEAVALCPLDRLMVETDSPFLAPVPHRGRPNRPDLVKLVGATLAELRAVAVEVVESATWATTRAFYGLDPENSGASPSGEGPPLSQ